MPRLFLTAIALLVFATLSSTSGQAPGDRVRLDSSNPQGVPVHPAAGDPAYVRWANGTIGRVTAVDAATGWIEVQSEGKRGWVTRRYITLVPEEDEPEPTPELEIPTYGVAAWNLEHFRDGAARGFPEYTNGGPTYGSRTTEDFERIASIIRTDLRAQVVVLSEINGRSGQTTSVEMDRLIGILGPTWQYRLTGAGGTQRVALMFDTAAVQLGSCQEITVAQEIVDSKDIFDRDPLACAFTFLDSGGQAKNDLVVVGVHLASGQALVANHNRAMNVLRQRLQTLFGNGTFPAGERDVLIGGDFNASRYDTDVEIFWTGFDPTGFMFRTLSPQGDEHYPGTRLAGVPLYPRSKIDYLMGSGRPGGITDELVQLEAEVHTHLLGDDFDDYREHVSDHLPVSVRVRVVNDDDP